MKNRFATIQGLRAIAMMSVVLYHAGLFSQRTMGHVFCGNLFGKGSFSVDFFFVVSGFIITLVHADDVGRPEMTKRFVLRRFFRIYPLLFLITTLKLLLILLANPSGPARSLDPSLVIHSFLLLPPPPNFFPLIQAAWTMPYEVLFYAAFVFVIILGKRFGVTLLGLWAAGIVLISTWLPGVLVGTLPFVFAPYSMELILGSLTGWVASRPNPPKVSPGLLIIGSAAALVGILALPHHALSDLWLRTTLGACYACLLLGLVLAERCGIAIPVPQWLHTLGDASYSIYLLHSPVMLALMGAGSRWGKLGTFNAHTLTIGATSIGFAAGLLCWFKLEKRMLAWGSAFTKAADAGRTMDLRSGSAAEGKPAPL